MTALQKAMLWVEANADALREFEWKPLPGSSENALIRCKMDGGQEGCPMSVLAPDGPMPVTDPLELADIHGLDDDVAADIADAADGYDDARPSLRRALLRATGLAKRGVK